MDCQYIQENLSDYLEGALPPEQLTDVATHLADCEDCAREIEDLKTTIAALRSLEAVTPPAGLWDEIRGAMDNELENPVITDSEVTSIFSVVTPDVSEVHRPIDTGVVPPETKPVKKRFNWQQAGAMALAACVLVGFVVVFRHGVPQPGTTNNTKTAEAVNSEQTTADSNAPAGSMPSPLLQSNPGGMPGGLPGGMGGGMGGMSGGPGSMGSGQGGMGGMSGGPGGMGSGPGMNMPPPSMGNQLRMPSGSGMPSGTRRNLLPPEGYTGRGPGSSYGPPPGMFPGPRNGGSRSGAPIFVPRGGSGPMPLMPGMAQRSPGTTTAKQASRPQGGAPVTPKAVVPSVIPAPEPTPMRIAENHSGATARTMSAPGLMLEEEPLGPAAPSMMSAKSMSAPGISGFDGGGMGGGMKATQSDAMVEMTAPAIARGGVDLSFMPPLVRRVGYTSVAAVVITPRVDIQNAVLAVESANSLAVMNSGPTGVVFVGDLKANRKASIPVRFIAQRAGDQDLRLVFTSTSPAVQRELDVLMPEFEVAGEHETAARSESDIDLTLEHITFRAALDKVAKAGGLTLNIAEDVKAPDVNIEFHKVPADAALRILCREAGLVMSFDKKGYHILRP